MAGRYEKVFNEDAKLAQGEMLMGIVSGRPMFASVDIELQKDQKVVADGKTLLWMDGHVGMETGCHGGCCAAAGRSCSGESCCMNTYWDQGYERIGAGYTGPAKVGLGFTLPGDMMSFGVTPGSGWILSQGAFVAGTHNLRVSGKFTGCCTQAAGEGLFLTHVTCGDAKTNGMFFAGGYGSIVRHDLLQGQVLFVDNGLFFAAHERTRIMVGPIGGCTATCCSGEGLVMKFFGPCSIFTQSRDPSIFDPPPPRDTQDGSGGGAASS
jgi:uncharacterized protein (TIGR00266 family)